MGEKVALGDVLAGRYRVEKVLGSGSMGVVVAARDERLDVIVTVKFMGDDALKDPDLVLGFLREGRAVGRLHGEHVARVIDVGTLESGAPYRVMEHLEGNDLSAILRSEGPQPIPRSVEYIAQACEALDEAHGAGIVHCNIKPSNLFLTKQPGGSVFIKVLDFGISVSNRLGSSSAKQYATHSPAALGSPFYMAPEQMRSASGVDARADIWALGATLYELLTGRVPFEADSLASLALRISQGDPVSIREIRTEVPQALERVVLQCLEKDRDARFATAGMLAAALSPFALRQPASLPGVVSRAEWSGDTPVDPTEDVFTPVAEVPVLAKAIAESVEPPPQESARPRRPVLRRIPVKAPTSVLPVVQSPPRFASGAASPSLDPSSQPSGDNRSRNTALKAMAVGILLGGGLTTALALRSSYESSKIARQIPSISASTAASTPPAASGAANEWSAVSSAPSPAPRPSTDASSRIPTVSVTDLPTAPRPMFGPPSFAPPVFVPPPYRPPEAQPVAPAPVKAPPKPNCEPPFYIDERGHKRFRAECFDSPSPAASTAPKAQASARTSPPAAGSAGEAPDPLATPH